MRSLEESRVKLIRRCPQYFNFSMDIPQIISIMNKDTASSESPWSWMYALELYIGRLLEEREWNEICEEVHIIAEHMPTRTPEKVIHLKALKNAIGFDGRIPQTLFDQEEKNAWY